MQLPIPLQTSPALFQKVETRVQSAIAAPLAWSRPRAIVQTFHQPLASTTRPGRHCHLSTLSKGIERLVARDKRTEVTAPIAQLTLRPIGGQTRVRARLSRTLVQHHLAFEICSSTTTQVPGFHLSSPDDTRSAGVLCCISHLNTHTTSTLAARFLRTTSLHYSLDSGIRPTIAQSAPPSPVHACYIRARPPNTRTMNGPQQHSPYHHQRQTSDNPPNGIANMQSPGRGNGAMPMPVGQRPPPYQMTPSDMGTLGAARSPPKNKIEPETNAGAGGGKKGRGGLSKRADTSHVPCKFYLQGQCQAGRMCPFSHDLESTTRPAPCKYFAKGHCKFGTKCALLHITPDGIVMNHKRYSQPPQYAQVQPPPGAYGQPPPGLLSMQALEQRPNGDMSEDMAHYQYASRNGYDMPQFDYTSASPKFGSPPQNDRLAFGSSPHQKGLSVLDAPLPNSFDSNGVSMAQRGGPMAASVPSRFGFESPPSSLPRKAFGNTALQDLHHSAFGGRGNLDSVLAGSSPPSGGDEPLSFPKRPLHSHSLRTSRPMIS